MTPKHRAVQVTPHPVRFCQATPPLSLRGKTGAPYLRACTLGRAGAREMNVSARISCPFRISRIFLCSPHRLRPGKFVSKGTSLTTATISRHPSAPPLSQYMFRPGRGRSCRSLGKPLRHFPLSLWSENRQWPKGRLWTTTDERRGIHAFSSLTSPSSLASVFGSGDGLG